MCECTMSLSMAQWLALLARLSGFLPHAKKHVGQIGPMCGVALYHFDLIITVKILSFFLYSGNVWMLGYLFCMFYTSELIHQYKCMKKRTIYKKPRCLTNLLIFMCLNMIIAVCFAGLKILNMFPDSA